MSLEEAKAIKNPLEHILNVKLPQEPITVDNEQNFTLLTNGLQMLLISRMPEHENDVDQNEDHSKYFRKVFEEIITADPNHFSGFETLRDIPEVLLVQLEQRIKEKQHGSGN
jgi:hypothetical protein